MNTRGFTSSGRLGAAAAAVVFLVAGFLGLGALSASADTAPPAGTPATVSADGLPTWQLNGVVWASVTVGNTVYVTGSFTRARPPGVASGGAGEITVSNIFAFDITTGSRITSFSHTLNAQGLAITASPDGSRIYVGGDFTSVDGQTRNRIAAFSTSSGTLISTFAPSPNGQVAGITASNGTVYYGGTFTSVSGVARTRLAAANASDGSLTSWAPTADDRAVKAMVLAPDGSRVIVGGMFTTLNHVAAYGMGAVSTSNGATLAWAANTRIQDAGQNGAINSLSTDGSLIYGSGFAFGAGSSFEGSFGASPSTGNIVFVNDCHGDTYDVIPVGQLVYTVGHAHDCSAIRSFPDTTNPRIAHRGLAFTNYATTTNVGPDSYGWNYAGLPASSLMTWYPTVTAGTYTGQNQGAWTITGNSNYVVLGGEFPTVNNVAQSGLVRFAVSSIAPNKIAPQSSSALTPVPSAQGGGRVRVNWTSTYDLDNQRLTYRVLRDSSNTPIYTSAATASSFWQFPALSFTDSGLAVGSTHTYRIQAVDAFGNVRTSSTSAGVQVN